MTTITRERLLKIQQWRETYGPGSSVVMPAEEAEELARIVLAAMDSEPVAWQIHTPVSGVTYVETNYQYVENIRNGFGIKVEITPLYRHAQQPVVPATLPCSVELKPGLIISKGCKTEILLTALRRRADYYAEIDAMTPEERAEHDANIEAFKAMLPLPAAPQEVQNRIEEKRANFREEMAMGSRLTKHRFRVK